ncbi:hypothetical protein [Paracoccus litorisediminis]|uniref:Uncharacterized protein n=1 Tax=Paracoccus litorisediminis TaxID=2006130 RepID=A0A844HQV0_9RHOB|nr:hypothetical protein [Paracoccus litorisediminis]MTH61438.1 hypothetical protein [Paracoccus litorisediminis]
MPKLKALRGSIGIYGRVKANGIVEVEEKDADKLLKSKRFVRATDADIAAAEKAQQDFLAVNMTGVTPGFAPVAVPKAADRLQAMIEGGAISKEKAQELLALQIDLSDDEVKAGLQSWIDERRAEVMVLQADLTTRDAELNDREKAHAEAVAAHEAEVQRVADLVADLDKREQAIAQASRAAQPPAADAKSAPEADQAKEDHKGKAAK